MVFLLPPYSSSLPRSIRKDRRVFFYDCAAAYDEAGGAQLENLVACSLLKYTQFRKDAAGENWELYYLRDKVDFVVTRNRRVQWLIEVKTSDGAVGSGLNYYAQKLRLKESLQLVLDLERAQESPALRSCHSPSGLRHCRLRVVRDESGEISAPVSAASNGHRPTALQLGQFWDSSFCRCRRDKGHCAPVSWTPFRHPLRWTGASP